MRPASIVMFERLYLAAWLIGMINSVLSWRQQSAIMMANPALAEIGPGLLYAIVGLGLAIPLVLWFLVARIRSAIAKWVLVALFALGVAGILLGALRGTFPPSGISGALAVLVFVLQSAAVWTLFRPDARAWFGETPAAETAP